MPAQKILKAFCLYVDGKGFAGEVEDFTPPKLSIKTDEVRAGGMDSPLSIDVGMEKLEVTFTLVGFQESVIQLFGLLPGLDTALILRGALEDYDGTVTPIIHTCRGRLREVDPGTYKAGERAALKVAADLNFYSILVAGAPVVTIDTKNMIRQIGGTDRLAKIRQAIGLTGVITTI